MKNLLGELNSDMSFGLDLDAFATKLELRMHGPVEHKVWAVSVECRHGGVVGHLFNKTT